LVGGGEVDEAGIAGGFVVGGDVVNGRPQFPQVTVFMLVLLGVRC
jgi:hypothetical protein